MFNRLSLSLFLLTLVSCSDALVYSDFQATTDGQWNKDDTKEFQISKMDSISAHDIFIMVRNDNTYPFSNLFLIAEINTPDSRVIRDTLEYEMASPDGNWLGKGKGSILENKLWFKENIVFSPSGVYTIRLSHAMRQNGQVQGIDNLIGITDVGIEIEVREQ